MSPTNTEFTLGPASPVDSFATSHALSPTALRDEEADEGTPGLMAEDETESSSSEEEEEDVVEVDK